MQPATSAFARFGQGVSHACARLHAAGTQFAVSAAHHLERALACCQRAARPQPPAHEVAPPLQERQVDVLPPVPVGDSPEAQRLQRLHRYLEESRVATANDPDHATRHVMVAFRRVLVEERILLQDDTPGPAAPRVPGQLDDAPAANDDGRFDRPRSDLW